MNNTFLTAWSLLARAGHKFSTYVQIAVAFVLLVCIESCTWRLEHPLIWYQRYDPRIGVDGIWTVNPITQQQRSVIQQSSIGAPAISPNGKYIAYSSGSQRGYAIWVANVDGTNPHQVTRDAEWTFHFWISDNDLVVAISDYVPSHLDPLDYYLYDMSNQQSRRISVERNGPYGDTGGVWNKLSSHPARTARLDDSKHVASVLWELRNANVESVTDYTISVVHFPDVVYPCCFSWTRDGASAVFQARDNLQRNIYDLFLASNKGQSVIRLTDFGKHYKYATVTTHAISPDGKWVILLARLDPDLQDELYRHDLILVSVENRFIDQLGQQRFDCAADCPLSLVWSPDSRYVATTWAPTGVITEQEVFVIDVQTKEIKQLTFDGGFKQVFD